MAATATKTETLKDALDTANPVDVADALHKVKLGTMVTPLKRAFTALTAAASFDLTTIDGTGETPTGATNPNRLAALTVGTLRVTASGTANSVGSYAVGDVAATLLSPLASTVVGLARLSDDGKTVTFLTTVTAFIVEYIPRPSSDMAARFAPNDKASS